MRDKVSYSDLTARRGGGDSFFGFVQKQLRDKCSGRLIALMLRELGRHEPEAFLVFLQEVKFSADQRKAIRGGAAQVETEWAYMPGRLADLAVIVDGQAILLLEVKEDDLMSSGNSDQLADYINHVADRSAEIQFVHFSRYSPLRSLGSLRSMPNVYDLRYRHLFEAVRIHENATGGRAPLSRMIREYLEDIGVDSYKQISLEQELDALTLLVTQMSGFDHFHGLGRLHSASNATLAPDLLRRLLSNAVVLGEWLLEPNASIIKQKPKSKFHVTNRYSATLLKRAISTPDPDDGLVDLPRKAVQEGILSVHASAALDKSGSQSWVYVTVGQYVTVSAATREKARFSLFVELVWKGGDGVHLESEDWFDTFPSESTATKELRTLLQRALKKAQKLDGSPAVFDKVSLPAPRT